MFGDSIRGAAVINKQTSGYWLCPLFPFDCDCEITTLAFGIQVRRADDEFRNFLRQHCFDADSLWDDPDEVDWVALLPCPKETSNILAEVNKIGDLLLDLVTTFRLHNKGVVTSGLLISMPRELIFTPESLHISIDDYLDAMPLPKYQLCESDVPLLNKLLRDVQKWRHVRNIDIALSRFNFAYRGEYEKRIIDQMIAFEALYLGDSQELKYKLALRTAFLLGKNIKQREGIFKNMNNAYKIRNDIVHGIRRPNMKKLEEILSQTEDYLRESICVFLSLLSKGYGLKKIREHLLDENILHSGPSF